MINQKSKKQIFLNQKLKLRLKNIKLGKIRQLCKVSLGEN